MANPWDFDTPIWYEHWDIDGYPTFEGSPIPPTPTPTITPDPSGLDYGEYYLYSNKEWEMAPSGVSFINLQHGIMQNAPVVVTPSGLETTTPSDPWARVSGLEKYQKVGFGYFDMLENGQYNPDAREFAISPDASGKLVFNGLLRENVYIEYESGPSGYYILDSIDYNPIRAEVVGGFVHFSETTDPASLSLAASQTSVRGDGYQGCTLTATLFDVDFDRVPYKDIIFEMQNTTPGTTPVSGVYSGTFSEIGYLEPNEGTVVSVDASGYSYVISERTNSRGEAHAHYLSHIGKAGVVEIKAYYAVSSGVYDIVDFSQFYLSAEPFTLDVSLLDTIDYMT